MRPANDMDKLTGIEDVRAFLDYEADLLDRNDYHRWLDLWEPEGFYILPIEREGKDHADRLNHVFDDHVMRRQRVERLLSGHAPSAAPIMRTVRFISRLRVMETGDAEVLVSSSLLIASYKRQVLKQLPADVTHRLTVRPGEGIRIREKIVRLIDSDEPLGELSFVL
ncbi:hypothetical protein HRJ34_10785 [Rhizorhabdus wittichii]|nr:aromatic-ring-hydroxylating dioxygenase subunit beta [Rhizorhabdus wittichii]QTH23943.1 hypothetical protein HRJ34_10785 [Rhizorhabdus wittichii]